MIDKDKGIERLAGVAVESRKKAKLLKSAFIGWSAQAFVCVLFLASDQVLAGEFPTNGQVVSGSANISHTANAMDIVQTSNKAAINWQTFDVGQGKSVNFHQPSASSIALNRVLGSDVSRIQGAINANGQVFLVNPNGVLFTPTAQVNAGALLASTLDISSERFNEGLYTFEGDSTEAVTNQGLISAASGGYVVLIASQIDNSGVVSAPAGQVLMGAGAKVTLDTGGPVMLEVEQGALDALIANGGAISAQGGAVHLSAKAANNLVSSVINHSGVVEANSLTSRGGEIFLEADDIVLQASSTISAAGAEGGGVVLVGGDWQGGQVPSLRLSETEMRQAETVTMQAGASIDASATRSGGGGSVVLWSDVGSPSSLTVAQGRITATGGSAGGDGGQIETSGHHLEIAGAQVRAGAANGKGGQWLLDPVGDTVIDNSGASTISGTLNGGTDVTYEVTGGNLTVSAAGANSIKKATGTATRTLTLRSEQDIQFSNGADITATSGKLNVVLWADTNGTVEAGGAGGGGGGIKFVQNNEFHTNGGHIWVGGGSTAGTAWNGLTVGDDFAHGLTFTGGVDAGIGTYFDTRVALAGVGIGDISISGKDIRQSDTAQNYGFSTGGSSFIWGDDIALNGTSAVNVISNRGISLDNTQINVAGDLVMAGVAGWAAGGTARSDAGIYLDQSSVIAGTTAAATVTIAGTNLNGSGKQHSGVVAEAGTSITTLGGAITITGTAGGGHSANDGVLIQGNVGSAGSGTLSITGTAGGGSSSHGIQIEALATLGASSYAKNITLNADKFNLSPSSVVTTGRLSILSRNNSFANDVVFGNATMTLGSFILGKTSNTQDITLSHSITATGNVSVYGGDLTVDSGIIAGGVITLKGSGAITDSATGYVDAAQLALLDGAVFLDHANNDTNTLAASGVDSLSFVDKDAFIVGTVGATAGIAATGAVDLATKTGDLTLSNNVSGSTIVANAGKNTAAGTSTGGNVVVTGSPTLTASSGNAAIYTGSVSGSTGLTARIGSGTGKFRYGSDESTTNFSTALGATGNYAIYREQPTFSVDNTTSVYGAALSSYNSTGLVNGDSASFSIASPAYSTSNNLAANTYTVNNTAGALGYSASTSSATVTQRSLAVSGLTAVSKVYDTSVNAVVSGSASSNKVSGDNVNISTAITFNNANVEASKTISLVHTLTGADASNYSPTNQSGVSSSALITVKPLTFSATKVYNGTTSLTGGVTLTGMLGGQTLNYTDATSNNTNVTTANKYISALTLTNGTGLASNYALPAFSYDAGKNSVSITRKSLTVSASKAYDGTTSLTGDVTLAGMENSETLNYTGAASNNSHVATVNKYISALTLANGTGLASNYALPALNYSAVNNNASITAATLTPTLTNTGVTKAYNGVTSAPNGFTPTWSYGGLASGDSAASVTYGGAVYDNANAGTASKITVSGISLTAITGSNSSALTDYALSATSKDVSASISKTSLTITANKDGKFVGASDPTFTGSYAGYVNGEAVGVLGGTLSISRSNAGVNTAGNFAGVLVASGHSSGNYNISYAAGNFTIVPSDQLLVTVANVTNIYGTATQYAVTDVEYFDGVVYSLSDGSVAGSSVANNGANVITVADGAGGTATFTLAALSAVTSTADKLAVGAYQLGTSGTVTEDSAKFSSTITVVGSHTVNVKGLTAVVTGVSKVYDATLDVASANFALSSLETNDVVSASSVLTDAQGRGSYSNKNAGTGLSYTLNNILLAGADSSNYFLTAGSTFNGTNGVITPAPLTASASKIYNGTTSLAGSVTLAGMLSGDTLNYTGATSNDSNVATSNKYISALTLTNGTGLASNYMMPAFSYEAGTNSVSITRKSLTASASKSYDGTTSLAGDVTLAGMLGGDTLNYTGAASNNSHVATSNKYISALTLTNGTGLASNYAPPAFNYNAANNNVSITTATLTPALTNTGVTKTYDGIVSAPGGFTPTWSYGGLVSGDTAASVAYTGAVYDNANVGTASKVTVSGISLTAITGSKSSAVTDYALSASSKDVSASISKTTLTVRANNNAKFVLAVDPAFTASYAGYVNGEVAGVLGGTLSISRSNAAVNTAGIFAGVLIPSGRTSSNYNISYTAGNFTIVPSNQLLVRVANVTDTYGTATQYTVNDVEYYDGSVYSLSDGSVAGSSVANNGANVITVADGVGGTATFTLGALSGVTSTANKLAVGTYQHGTSGTVTENSANFSNTITVVGSHTVNVKGLTASVTGVSKVYDATVGVASASFVLSTLETNDVVGARSLRSYSNKNAGTGLGYTLRNILLTGADASNYFLTSGSTYNGTNGVITPAPVTASASKAYDGTTSLAGSVTLAGMLSGDTLNYTGATSNDSHVALVNKHISALTLTNGTGLASNYAPPAFNYSAANNNVSITASTLTPVLSNTGVTKTYDGTINAPNGFAPTWVYGGLVSGDTAASVTYGGAVYDNPNSGTASKVTVSGILLTAITGNNNSALTDYSLSASSRDVSASITPINLAASASPASSSDLTPLAISASKVYDGTTSLAGNVTLSGMLDGETLNYTGATSNDSHVATANKYISALTLTNGTGLASNYALPAFSYSAVNNNVSITAATLTPTLSNNNVTKTYDGATSAPKGFTPIWTYAGLATGDTAASVAYTRAIYDNADVGTASKVTVSGISLSTITGSNSSALTDYALSASSRDVPASITTKTLTVSVSASKVYDGTTSLAGSVILSGMLDGETLNYTGATSNDSHVATANKYISALTLADGTGLASNYTLPALSYSAANNNVSITAATLTPTLSNNNVTKTYDGATSAPTGFTPTWTYAGLVTGDTAASVAYARAVYDNADVGTASKVTVSGLSLSGITGTKSSATTDYGLSTSSRGVSASITEKPLTLSAIKVYDGTTSLTGSVTLGGMENSETLNYTGATSNDSHVATANKYISALTLADGTGLASNYTLPALSYSSHNKVIISDSASSILGSGFDPVERRCMGVARSRHCLSSGLEVEVAEPVNFEPEVVEQETIEVGSNRDAFDEVARQYQDFAEVDVPPLTATSGATPGQDDQSQGQLSAVTGGDSRSDATALGDTENAVLDQRITELETQLAQGPEEVNGVRVEREEIDSRMADLEAQIEPSQEIIRLRNIQLAQLQDSLNAAAARFITEQQAIQDAAEAEAAALSDSGTSLTDDVMRILVGNSIFLLFSIVLAILLLVLLERLIKKRAR